MNLWFPFLFPSFRKQTILMLLPFQFLFMISSSLWYFVLIFLQLFDWMQKNGRISISSYSSYIKFMGKGLNPVKALEIYNNIEDELTRNNVSVCNSVLSCLVWSGKFESSIRLFHQMKKDGLKPDVVTYTTVCHFCHIIIYFPLT